MSLNVNIIESNIILGQRAGTRHSAGALDGEAGLRDQQEDRH